MNNEDFNKLEMKEQLSYINKKMHTDTSKKLVIPHKVTKKNDTQAFNIVVVKSLVKKLDKSAKAKGYSRNQLVNYILEFFMDNIE